MEMFGAGDQNDEMRMSVVIRDQEYFFIGDQDDEIRMR